jgi:hypothetical protein
MAQMKQVKLKVVEMLNPNYESSTGVEYVIFKCMNDEKETLSVAVSHNALKQSQINVNLLDGLEGSVLTISNTVDKRNGSINETVERIEGVLDGSILSKDGTEPGLVTVNQSNCRIQKSEVYINEMKDFISTTDAKVTIEKEKQKRLEKNRRLQETLKASERKPLVVNKQTEDEVEDVVFETNAEDTPF